MKACFRPSGKTSPRYMLDFIGAIIVHTGGEPLKRWRPEGLLPNKTYHQCADPPPAAQNPVAEQPITEESSEPTCEKSTAVDGTPERKERSDRP